MGCDGGTRSAPIFTRAEKGLKMEHLLEVKNLSVTIDGFSGEVQAVRDVSFSLYRKDRLRRSLELKNARTEAGTTTRRSLD